MVKRILNTIPRPVLIKLSIWGRPFLDFFYRGSRFSDPINGKTYRKFLPYGYGKIRENVLSPGTLSLERHRLLWLYLKNETSFFTQKLSVLHIAPEQAFHKRFKKLKNLEYITADLNSPIADFRADVCDLPFEDNRFDCIICNHVLEHVEDDLTALKEFHRVLKPGGMAVLQVPYDRNLSTTFEDSSITDPKERARIFGQYDHVRIYGMDYFDRLRSAGFEVEAVDYTKDMDPVSIERYRLPEGELIPVVRKSIQ